MSQGEKLKKKQARFKSMGNVRDDRRVGKPNIAKRIEKSNELKESPQNVAGTLIKF